jgi:hypothetical protein
MNHQIRIPRIWFSLFTQPRPTADGRERQVSGDKFVQDGTLKCSSSRVGAVVNVT